MGIIYKITNIKTQKSYIGKTTKSLEDRWSRHYYDSNYCADSFLHKSIKKHGPENFIKDILEECDDTLLDEKEMFYIEKHQTYIPLGYNMTRGGEGGDTSKSPNHIKAMQQIDRSGKNGSMFGKLGPNNPNFGKRRGKTPKISIGQKLNWDNNPQRRQLMSERFKGKNNPGYKHGKYCNDKL